MNYVKCINNQPYLQPLGQPPQEEPLLDLTIGKVYKALFDRRAETHGMIRVIDESYGEAGSENGYLYPADYFELFKPNGNTQLTHIEYYDPSFRLHQRRSTRRIRCLRQIHLCLPPRMD